MNLKYKHTDGLGKIYSGFSQAELAAQSFCVQVFGELERPLTRDEQINATTGAIEPIPLTAEQQEELDERTAAKNILDNLKDLTFVQFQALTQTQKERVLYFVMKREIRGLK